MARKKFDCRFGEHAHKQYLERFQIIFCPNIQVNVKPKEMRRFLKYTVVVIGSQHGHRAAWRLGRMGCTRATGVCPAFPFVLWSHDVNMRVASQAKILRKKILHILDLQQVRLDSPLVSNL